MKRAALAIILIFLAVSCGLVTPEKEEPEEQELSIRALGMPEDIVDEFSYVFGYMLAASASEYGDNIDYNYVARGVVDYAEGRSFYAPAEMDRILTLHQRNLIRQDRREAREQERANRESAWAFLIANGKRRSVVTLPSGVEYEILEKGDGQSAENALSVIANYQISLPDGSVAYSTNGQSVLIRLDDAIPGLADGIRTMEVGDKIRLWVPPELGYSDNKPPYGIEPSSLLIYDITLSDVIEQG